MAESIKKNTPKGALCKYRNSFEWTFTKLWCFTSFLKTWLESVGFSWVKNSTISRLFRTISTDSFHKIWTNIF